MTTFAFRKVTGPHVATEWRGGRMEKENQGGGYCNRSSERGWG